MNRRDFIKSSALGAGIIGSGSLQAMSLSRDAAMAESVSTASYCLLPAHEIPVIADVDVIIAGGTSGAVAAAAEAAKGGAACHYCTCQTPDADTQVFAFPCNKRRFRNDLLQIPGMRQTVVSTYHVARNTAVLDNIDDLERNRVLKELHLVRALYRCGDKEGLGASILRAYSNDLNNHYARHASGILELS